MSHYETTLYTTFIFQVFLFYSIFENYITFQVIDEMKF